MPREINDRADLINRRIGCDDWHLNPAVFDKPDICWGPHKVDRFADHKVFSGFVSIVDAGI